MVEPNFKIKAEVEREDYGKFIIEPLEQGYGQTLGNSLRRVLLSALSGAAITSVKIEGIKHQFSTLPGLKEDVVELVLNLKKVRLSIEGDEQVVLTLSKKGPGEVYARDIEVPSGVSIVNPDLVLGTLADKKASLEMTMTAGIGYGYVSVDSMRAEMGEKRVEEIGKIPMDALFSPVSRVNYRVEATRVGRMTNLDKLVMEVWTDGTILPIDAIRAAAKILVSYFMQIVEPKVHVGEEGTRVTASVSDELLKMRIEELDIPTRIVNALSKSTIDTIGQLLATPRSELMKVKNLGAKSLAVVEERLKEKGIVLSA